jgi:GNAT superfamily N-acetyltransferase
MQAQARRRAIAFMTAIDDACAEATVACPGGTVVLDSRHPALWSANHVRVDAARAPDATALDATAAAHLDELGFRMIVVQDEAVAAALAEPLGALGYRPADELLMILGPTGDAARRSARVGEATPAQLVASRVAAQTEIGRDAQVGRQLASRDALIASVVPVRRLAIRAANGEVAARCQIYGEGAVAQIENLYTAAARRGQGLSRLLMRHAVAEARAGGAELVFLVADAGDWPQSFYRRLGFEDAGLMPRFLRR